jgi:hypothetical protein
VRGGFNVIDPQGEHETWMRAVALLRTLVPETFRAGDPVPARTVLFRIDVQTATGREATPPPSPS